MIDNTDQTISGKQEKRIWIVTILQVKLQMLFLHCICSKSLTKPVDFRLFEKLVSGLSVSCSNPMTIQLKKSFAKNATFARKKTVRQRGVKNERKEIRIIFVIHSKVMGE